MLPSTESCCYLEQLKCCANSAYAVFKGHHGSDTKRTLSRSGHGEVNRRACEHKESYDWWRKMGQMALWSKWFPANWLLCRQKTITLKPSHILRSPTVAAPMTPAVMCVSNPCRCATLHMANKPLGRLPTSQVHGVNARDLKLYMHPVDTHAYRILDRKHPIAHVKAERADVT